MPFHTAPARPVPGRAALADGFERLGLSEVVSYAVLGNEASFRVMERIGMTRDAAGDLGIPGREPPPDRAALYRIRCRAPHA